MDWREFALRGSAVIITGIIAIAAVSALKSDDDYHSEHLMKLQKSMDSTNVYYAKQLEQMYIALQRQWQPNLVIEYCDFTTIRCGYYYGEPKKSPSNLTRFESLSIKSGEFIKNVDHAYLGFLHHIRLLNLGNSSLRFISSYSNMMTENEWKDSMHGSYDTLVSKIISNNRLENNEFDVWLQRNDTLLKNEEEQFVSYIYIKKDEFLRYSNSKKLILYPYTYIQYEDYFGYKYDALLISRIDCELGRTIKGNDEFITLESNVEIRNHKYRVNIAQFRTSE